MPGTRAVAGPVAAPPRGASRAARRPLARLVDPHLAEVGIGVEPLEQQQCVGRQRRDQAHRAEPAHVRRARASCSPSGCGQVTLSASGSPSRTTGTTTAVQPGRGAPSTTSPHRSSASSRRRGTVATHSAPVGPAVRRVGRHPRHPVGRQGDRAHPSAGNGSSSRPSGGPAPRPSRATGSPPTGRLRSRMPRAHRGARVPARGERSRHGEPSASLDGEKGGGRRWCPSAHFRPPGGAKPPRRVEGRVERVTRHPLTRR